MTPKIDRNTTRAELAAIVSAILKELNDDPVLVGGAVVSIYTEGRYVSDDLDMVSWRRESQYRPLLEARGFKKKGSYWVHPDTGYFVQFVPGPVMPGGKYVPRPSRIETAFGECSILSPLDCTIDRFAWYVESGDAEALEQAVDVAKTKSVSLEDVKTWLDGENDWPAPQRQQAFARLVRRVTGGR